MRRSISASVSSCNVFIINPAILNFYTGEKYIDMTAAVNTNPFTKIEAPAHGITVTMLFSLDDIAPQWYIP